jgi:proteic killer suppression protein
MKIEFADPHLGLIRTAQAHKLGLPIAVIKAVQKKLLVIEAASTEKTLKEWKSLNYKQLEGSDERQIRINDQYRMRFKLNNGITPPVVTVTFIGDPH